MIRIEDVDLTKEIPATAPVVEAMRLRIFQLQDQLAQDVASPAKEPPTKRARTTASAPAPAASDDTPSAPTPSAPTAASTKAEEKKRKVQLEKIFDSVKFQGSSKTIKVDQAFEADEFDALLKTSLEGLGR
ncbi:hypothetical protein BDV98DRAFT_606825 [Pterulicium gracile]|uniref:Uncharacterized protein n=1 Tax=Pterulicium gracile TaxID=1884261 RepID=A0A5C3QBF7_9AGAR|nr:hypothetical protein BDV98DRAFT_606825 [Pterula gracilis]